jgi:hypothetical protein
LQDYLEFKWNNYAKQIHYLGFVSHLIYLIVFSTNVSYDFVYRDFSQLRILKTIQAITLIYPLVYDMTQLRKQGFRDYFREGWNFFDQSYIWIGYINLLVQRSDGKEVSIQLLHFQKVMMIVVTFLMLIKTFFFLRIFMHFSYLVTMMRQVVYDLKVFLVFYGILVWMCALIFNILQIGNYELSPDPQLQSLLSLPIYISYPGQEYKYIPYFMRQVISIIRISLGDFNFDEAVNLDKFENRIFWFVWLIMVIMTCIVFLNFIIAEVSSSYADVKLKLQGLFLKERCKLIKEAEDMMIVSQKQDKKKFPLYLITREVES